MPHADQQNSFDPDRYRDAEAQLGGADDVEKTTYVVGEGTAPERRRTPRAPNAASRHGSGLLIAIIVALVMLGAIWYLVSVAR